MAIYHRIPLNIEENSEPQKPITSFVSHFAGIAIGLTLGMLILHNSRKKTPDGRLCSIICIFLLLYVSIMALALLYHYFYF